MNETLLRMLDFAQGPLFRFSFALMVLGILRYLLLGASDAAAAYLVAEDKSVFWQKVRLRLLWFTFPSIVMRRAAPETRTRTFAYHLMICTLSLIFRLTAFLVPAFMVAHVYLWERNLGIGWIAMPARVADVLTIVTIVAGLTLFLARLYSPVLRKLEPPWSFLRPLILVLPFATGLLAMHPAWSPFDYHVVLLVHMWSAALVFVLIPFGRLMACMHTPLTEMFPSAAWRETDPNPETKIPIEAVVRGV